MGLSPGSKLGPYEIVAPLGAGGMGEVYKARDTRLDRTVAIKVLPTCSPRTRSCASASTAKPAPSSRLAHTNICALFDVGDQDGVDYLVMELLDGETLAARLAQGAAARSTGPCDRDRHRRRARRRAPRRHRPPRPQAGQRHADESRREAARLRPGQGRHAGRRGHGRCR